MTDDPTRRRPNKLGRGLSALLGEEEEDQARLDRLRQTRSLPVERLVPGPFQPRRRFDPEDLAELAESIREQGVLQPILVRRAPEGENYEIIAGERRWRAAQMAQLHEVPVLVREFDDRTAMEIALVENVQRRDLTALEEAEGYQRLIEDYGHSQDEIGRAVGKSRSHIANTLRLLNLPDEVRGLLDDGQLTAGHARALIGHPQAAELARHVVIRKLNVRETERLVQRGRTEPAVKPDGVARKAAPATAPGAESKDADTLAVERDLGERLGLTVSIDHDAISGGGSLTVRYGDLDQLDLVIERLSGIATGRSGPAAPPAEAPPAAPSRWSFDDDEEEEVPAAGALDPWADIADEDPADEDAADEDSGAEDEDDPLIPKP